MRPITTTFSMTLAFIKRYFRIKTALFFTFVFPLIFLFIFGGIFGNDKGPSFDVALLNHSQTAFSKTFIADANKGKVLKLKDVASLDEAKKKLGRGEFDAIMELPESFGALNAAGKPTGTIISYYDEGDQQSAQSFAAVVTSILGDINSQFVKVDVPFKLTQKPIKTANLRTFDYTFSGLIGFSILGLAIFGMSEGFTGDKKSGALRRVQVAPIKKWQLILATAFTRIFVGLLTIVLMFVVASTVFHFQMRGNYLTFAVFSTLGTFCLFGFGMAIAGWASDSNQAAPLSNLISFPMMFLSGVFFPRFLMPEWLQKVSTFIPLTPVVDGMRLISTEGKSLLDLGPQLAIIGGWTIIIYLIAFKVFRWE